MSLNLLCSLCASLTLAGRAGPGHSSFVFMATLCNLLFVFSCLRTFLYAFMHICFYIVVIVVVVVVCGCVNVACDLSDRVLRHNI